MHLAHAIEQSRRLPSAARAAWCELWIQAAREDQRAARTDRDLQRLAYQVTALQRELVRIAQGK